MPPPSGNNGHTSPIEYSEEQLYISEIMSHLSALEQSILEQRAYELAILAEQEQDTATYVEVLTFRLGAESYALDVAGIRRVLPLEQLTAVPCTPAFVAGIINLQGEMLSLLDIRHFLGIPQVGISDLMHIIVIEAAGLRIGLLANEVGEVLRVPVSDFSGMPITINESYARYARGVSSDGLIFLDLEALMSDSRVIINEEVF